MQSILVGPGKTESVNVEKASTAHATEQCELNGIVVGANVPIELEPGTHKFKNLSEHGCAVEVHPKPEVKTEKVKK